MQNEIVIRIAEPKDIDAMHRVIRNTWLATFPNKDYGISYQDIDSFIPETISAENFNKIQERLVNKNLKTCDIVSLINNKIVGVCGGLQYENNVVELKSIYVLPEYQGNGIGNLLWKNFEKSFTNVQHFTIHVAEYNEKAIQFYKSLGFIKTNLRIIDERFHFQSGATLPEIEMVYKV